ncbi:MAG: aminotransferase class I/II-fold pyridoxal phosphate-dependent enzyme [Myxococcales bacterium]|nr:aminotransferase class I/II-fold pyridoxal phosphate-dependent enzyme [Myxococcales bacterium]
MSQAPMPHLTRKLQGFGTSIFAEMTALAARHQAVNLGQGFPDFDGPDFLKRAAIAAIEQGKNQYARSHGMPVLNAAIAQHRARFYGLSFDPETEITVMNGATECIAATMLSLLDEGDEVVTFEPFYDSYPATVAMAGGRLKVVTLRAPEYAVDLAALRAAIGPRTRAILVNTPHNPCGKVFTRAELEGIAALCVEHDLLAVTDEVYEHLVFDGEHVAMATLPGMRDRTVMISSTGKTFSFTGWKIGYVCASPALTRAVRTSHQFLTFCNSTPFQFALAEGLVAGDDYFEGFVREYRARRDRMCEGLASVGFEVLVPQGTYFVCTDIRALGFDDDMAMCRALPEAIGVAAIPNSAFYANKAEGRHLVRWAFCKSDAVLDEGLARLRKNIGKLAGAVGTEVETP